MFLCYLNYSFTSLNLVVIQLGLLFHYPLLFFNLTSMSQYHWLLFKLTLCFIAPRSLQTLYVFVSLLLGMFANNAYASISSTARRSTPLFQTHFVFLKCCVVSIRMSVLFKPQ